MKPKKERNKLKEFLMQIEKYHKKSKKNIRKK